MNFITNRKVTAPAADIIDMSLFLHDDYRHFISEYLGKLPKNGRGELTKMAKALGVHQTLMSLVIAGERDLSVEQGYDLAVYIGLTDLESEYFSLLIQFARAGTARYKKVIQEKLEKIKKDATQISKRVAHEKILSDQQRAVIYSSWIYSAVRLFASMEDKGKTIEQVQERFQISRQRTIDILNFLESTGLVTKENDSYKMGTARTFLEHGSPHALKHHSNWRVKSLQQADEISEKELMFTCPVSLSKKDFEQLREQMAEFIKSFLSVVKDSPAEELACLNMDFFWIKK